MKFRDVSNKLKENPAKFFVKLVKIRYTSRMFIEIWQKESEDDKESFDFFLTKKLLNPSNEFLNLSEIASEKVLKTIDTKSLQLLGHAAFEKNENILNSSAFFPFGEHFRDYLKRKKSGKVIPKNNLYKKLKGVDIPIELNKKVIYILEKKYPEVFIIHKDPNKFRQKVLAKKGIKKGKKYPISEYREKISRDLENNDII